MNSLDDPNGTIRRIKTPSRRRRDGLIQYAYDRTSQSGEDGIINFLFRKLPTTATKNENGVEVNNVRWVVDVGAWDGKHLSNSYSLFFMDDETTDAKKKKKCINSTTQSRNTKCSENETSKNTANINWKGVFIEADENKHTELKALHDPLGNICHNVSVSCQTWSEQSLANIMLQTQSKHPSLPNDLDFLCIDVDGTDYWLLHNIFSETSFRPKVICIEFNPTIPHSVFFIPPRNDTKRFGCSITALNELASTNGYQLVETTCYNTFFVRNDLYVQHIKDEIPFEPCIDNLHEITMGTQLYQLYDGTIKLSGCQKMLWHRKPIREEDVQILSAKDRNFPFAPSSSSTTSICTTDEPSLKEKYLMEQMKQEAAMLHNMAVDMSPYCCSSSNNPDRDESLQNECSSSIFQQLEKDGFALVRGTGIPSDTCQKALQWTESFLQDAHEKVRRSCLTKDRARRGYSPQNSENFASLIGQKGSNDLVRKFRIGPHQDVNHDFHLHPSSTLPSSFALLQANAWPSSESWGEENAIQFKDSIEKYYDKICDVADSIVCAICDGIVRRNEDIKLPLSLIGTQKQRVKGEDMNDKDHVIDNTSILTLLGYKKGARHQGKHTNPLIAAHTDVGVITILLFDGGDSSVLQRAQSANPDNSNSWVDVKLPAIVPQDPIFVVNIGDCLSDMSGGMLPSTLHRVMPCKGGTRPRNCLALFMGLKPDEIISQSDEESISYEEWRRRRIARAQAELRRHTKGSTTKE